MEVMREEYSIDVEVVPFKKKNVEVVMASSPIRSVSKFTKQRFRQIMKINF